MNNQIRAQNQINQKQKTEFTKIDMALKKVKDND